MSQSDPSPTNNPYEIRRELPKEKSEKLGYLIIPIFAALFIAAVIFWFMKKDPEEAKFFPVTGRVTYNGEPLEGKFQINFYPVDGSKKIASGTLSRDGNFKLIGSAQGYIGAMAGEYRVQIKMFEEGDEPEYMNMQEVQLSPVDGGTMTPPEPDPPFPKIYSDRDLTPQRAIVEKNQNVINIDIKDL